MSDQTPEPSWWANPRKWSKFERAAMEAMLYCGYLMVQSNLSSVDPDEAGDLVDNFIYKLMGARLAGGRGIYVCPN